MEEDEEEGRHQAQVSLQRHPEEVFGDSDADAKLYPVTELDPEKVKEREDSVSTLGRPRRSQCGGGDESEITRVLPGSGF